MKLLNKIKKITKIEFRRRSEIMTKTTMIINFVWSIVKIGFGLIFASYFIIVSGIYTLILGGAKSSFIIGDLKETKAEQLKHYLLMTILLLIASLAYVVYMARLFFYPEQFNFGEILSITITVIAFSELAIAIIGLTKANKQKDLLLSGVKSINLTSGLTSIVFAQSALLGFVNSELNMSFYNALAGVIFGAGCIGVCGFMFTKYLKVKRRILEDEKTSVTC